MKIETPSAWGSKDPIVENAIIESTRLGGESHGIFTAFITMKYDGGGQSFGGYGMDEPMFDGIPQYEGDTKGKFLGRRGTAWGMEFIKRILDTLEVNTWEELKGKPCRVYHTHCDIVAIGHYLKNQWFCPKEDLKDFLDTKEEAAA